MYNRQKFAFQLEAHFKREKSDSGCRCMFLELKLD